jgi:hypothetical protein
MEMINEIKEGEAEIATLGLSSPESQHSGVDRKRQQLIAPQTLRVFTIRVSLDSESSSPGVKGTPFAVPQKGNEPR